MDVTLKQITAGVWDANDQLDVGATTWDNTTIRVLLSTGTAQISPSLREGFAESQNDMVIIFKSDCTVAVGDYVEIDSILWRVEELNTRTYQGMTPIKGRISTT